MKNLIYKSYITHIYKGFNNKPSNPHFPEFYRATFGFLRYFLIDLFSTFATTFISTCSLENLTFYKKHAKQFLFCCLAMAGRDIPAGIP